MTVRVRRRETNEIVLLTTCASDKRRSACKCTNEGERMQQAANASQNTTPSFLKQILLLYPKVRIDLREMGGVKSAEQWREMPLTKPTNNL